MHYPCLLYTSSQIVELESVEVIDDYTVKMTLSEPSGDDYYNEDSEKHNIAECIVAKNRHGETGKVELRWMPEYTQFSTLDTRYDED